MKNYIFQLHSTGKDRELLLLYSVKQQNLFGNLVLVNHKVSQPAASSLHTQYISSYLEWGGGSVLQLLSSCLVVRCFCQRPDPHHQLCR